MQTLRPHIVAALAILAAVITGCEGQAFVIGNAFAMGVTCFLLYSTLNLKKK